MAVPAADLAALMKAAPVAAPAAVVLPPPVPVARPHALAPHAALLPVAHMAINRPVLLAKPKHAAPETADAALAPTPPPDHQAPGVLDWLFKGASPAPAEPVLAYAPEPSGLAASSAVRAQSGGGTAVYDIEAHTVTLPNGVQLEAHSGQSAQFGSQYVNMEDDSRYANVGNHGPTPSSPQGVVYKLSLREAKFHGVQALRLTPISGETYGRSGLLAHTYMLGPYGESNGCISFKNYAGFLNAYLSGKIDRVVVIGRYAPATPDIPTQHEHSGGRRRFASNYYGHIRRHLANNS